MKNLCLYPVLLAGTMLTACHTSPDQRAMRLESDLQREYALWAKEKNPYYPAIWPTTEQLRHLETWMSRARLRIEKTDTAGMSAEGKKYRERSRVWLSDRQKELATYRMDAGHYQLLGLIEPVVSATQRSPEEKARQLILLFRDSPHLLAQAKLNLTGQSDVDFASGIRAQVATITFLYQHFQAEIVTWPLTKKAMAELQGGCSAAIGSCKDYIAWCESRRIAQIKETRGY